MKIPFELVLILILSVWVSACKEDEEQVDPVTRSLTETLDQELVPLSYDPAQWTDEELRFLDEFSDQAIVGLGEATHGTAEFFKAKHRMFKYLVENHGFKIFAIEADLGESILINQAVMNGDKSQIESLMKQKMHFWTWQNTDVRDLLYWMCDYNIGKADEEKIQYWGVDCQFNTYYPDMVMDHLAEADVSFISFAEGVLTEVTSASISRFENYTQPTFSAYLGKINALKDSLMKYEADIIVNGSEKKYQVTLQLVEQIKQVSEVMFYSAQKVPRNYRDEFMAKNTGWLHGYFNGAGIVLWAHNFHVSDYLRLGTMGHHLKADFPDDYATVGFLFSTGSFTAVTQTNGEFTGLRRQFLDERPKPGSLNDVMSRAKADVFTVTLSDLQKHDRWQQSFLDNIQYFEMGSTYNNNPSSYYRAFDDSFFDRIIYFDNTRAAIQLE